GIRCARSRGKRAIAFDDIQEGREARVAVRNFLRGAYLQQSRALITGVGDAAGGRASEGLRRRSEAGEEIFAAAILAVGGVDQLLRARAKFRRDGLAVAVGERARVAGLHGELVYSLQQRADVGERLLFERQAVLRDVAVLRVLIGLRERLLQA